MRWKTVFALTLGLVVAASRLVWIQAQAPGFQRTVLQRGDLSVAGHEGVMAIAEFAPGASVGRHTHPGEEISYVLEGNITVDVQGMAPMVLKAGDVFLVQAGKIHNATNAGTTRAKIIATYVVEKGKPLTTPVQ